MIIRQWYFPHSIIILETNAVLEFSALNRMIRWVVKREGLLFGYMVCSEYLQVNYPLNIIIANDKKQDASSHWLFVLFAPYRRPGDWSAPYVVIMRGLNLHTLTLTYHLHCGSWSEVVLSNSFLRVHQRAFRPYSSRLSFSIVLLVRLVCS